MTSDPSNGQNEAILLKDVNSKSGICTLTLNRPAKRNALSTELVAALQDTFDSIADDISIKVVVLAANGPVFSSGHDLKEMRTDSSYDAIHALFLQCSEMMVTMTRMPQPFIARVHGVATAAGCQLVAGCDLAIASGNAKFATPGVTNGLFCSTPAVALSRAVGRKQAMEMLLTARLISAEEALQFGLINKVVPLEELDAAVENLALNIAGRSSMTIAVGKDAFYKQLTMELDDAYTYASDVMARNMCEPDAHEGIDAFLEKREPVWRGRE